MTIKRKGNEPNQKANSNKNIHFERGAMSNILKLFTFENFIPNTNSNKIKAYNLTTSLSKI